MRAAFTTSAYGLDEGLRSIPRLLIGNVVAMLAAARDKRAYMSLPAVAAVASVPVIWLIYTVHSSILALALGLMPAFLQTVWYGPVYATGQSVVSPARRT